jgi:DNA-binding CsgD family transcriptional regulator/tetratricopeptide (TPR) repeat protein
MQAPFVDPLSRLEQLKAALPLVGRDAEMQLIRQLLQIVALDAPQGARALTISGEMGIGKTRLLAALYAEAQQIGFRVLEASAYEVGNMSPYFPFVEALRPFLLSTGSEKLRRYTGLTASEHATGSNESGNLAVSSAALITALARLFPGLPALLQIEPTTEILPSDQEKFRLLDAVATLLERVSVEQPVLLAIDNLQWADSASLELMLYLTVRLRGARIALVGATRPPRMPEERGDDLPASTMATRALTELMRNGMLLILLLGTLSEAAATEHLQALLPGTIPPSVAQAILTRIEGNPFFLEEMVRTLTINQQLVLRDGAWRAASVSSTKLPASIVLAVEQRLQGISASCQELLQVAALCGRTFPVDALQQVLAKSAEEVQASINEAVQASVIAQLSVALCEENEEGELATIEYPQMFSSQSYIFCQGIVHEVLQAEVLAYRARQLHAALGRALEAMYGPEADEHAAELARHYAAGGEKEATLRWSLLAGEDAARQQAHREAISHFRLVLKLLGDNTHTLKNVPTRAELHLAIGELWFKLGELEQAGNAFQQALTQLQSQPEEVFLLARANRLSADVYRMQAKYEQALAHLQAARTAFSRDAQANEITSTDRLTYVPWLPGRGFPTGTPAGLEQISINERVQLLQAQAMLDLLLGRPAEAEPALWQSYQLAIEIGDRGSQAFALQIMSWIRGWGERIHETIRLQKQANELYLALGDPFRAALVEQGLGSIYQALGEMEQAYLYTQRALARARRYGVYSVIGWLYWNQATLALSQGQWERCEEHLQQALQEAIATNNTRLKATTLQARAELQFRRGNWSEAEQVFQDALQAATNTDWLPSTLALYGHFLAVTGRSSQARVQIERAIAHPTISGFSGDFYIPFLAEALLHIDAPAEAATYVERIKNLRGFMYYGNAVDRILGIVAVHTGDWEIADRAFEGGLVLCRRANNQPEEAAILYEQARAALICKAPLQQVYALCDQARALFAQYGMQRAIAMVDTLREGATQLERKEEEKALDVPAHISSPIATAAKEHQIEYVLKLTLTKREIEVLRLVAEGHTDREVAEMLIISPRTANRHLSNIFVKLDVPGRAAAVAYAIRQGLV